MSSNALDASDAVYRRTEAHTAQLDSECLENIRNKVST